MGTIEWVDRENDRLGVVDGQWSRLSRKDLSVVLGYDEEQCNLVDAARKMERQTRHKAQPPPFLSRITLVQQGILS
jgi:hypothetical protein